MNSPSRASLHDRRSTPPHELAALAVDHFGWLEVDRVPASPARLAGAALVVVGMLLLRKR